MFERIVLAGVVTFCVYLFLNLGGTSSTLPSFDAQQEVRPELVNPIALFS